MVISHHYRFIFVKCGKAAGTSIEVFLSGICPEQDVFTPLTPAENGHRPRNFVLSGERLRAHMPAREIRSVVGEDIWRDYLSFCIVRNPWDVVASQFRMLKARGQAATFPVFVRSLRTTGNIDLYTDANRNIMVDRVLRYEKLGDELAAVFGLLGIPYAGSLGVFAKRYPDQARGYRDYYDPQTRAAVATAFREEIALLGYRF